MPPKRQTKRKSVKQMRRKSARKPKRSLEKVDDLPSCPLKYGLKQIRDIRTGQCKLVAEKMQRLSPDRRILSRMAINLDKIADQLIANLEVARQATFALQDNPLNKKAYSALATANKKIDGLIVKVDRLFQEANDLLSNDSSEPNVVSDANSILSVVKSLAVEMTDSYSAIENVVGIPQSSANAKVIIREARNTQRQLEKAQRAGAQADDTAALSMKTALGVLGGAALLGGGLALVQSRFASQPSEDEPTNVEKEQTVRSVVVSRPQGGSAASVVDQTLSEDRKRQLANEERLRNLRQQLKLRKQQFDEIKTRHEKSIALFLTRKNDLEQKLGRFEETMKTASELSRKLSENNKQLVEIRQSLDDINENIKKANEKIARNELAVEKIVQAVKNSNISRDHLEAELQKAKQIAQGNKIKLDELITGLVEPTNTIRSALEIIKSTAMQIENDRRMLQTISDDVAKLRQQLLDISQTKSLVFEAFDLGDEAKVPIDVAEILKYVDELEKQIAELRKLSEQTEIALKIVPTRIEIFTTGISLEEMRDLISNPNNGTFSRMTRSQAKAPFVSEDDAWTLLVSQLENHQLSVLDHLSLMFQFLNNGNVFAAQAGKNIQVSRTQEKVQTIAQFLEKTKKRFDANVPIDVELQATIRKNITNVQRILRTRQQQTAS